MILELKWSGLNNLLGIDFEEWYHPELIQKSLTSEKKIPYMINGLDKILNLLEKHETLATFFVVGELLQHSPDLIDKIISGWYPFSCAFWAK